jgi:hypothetical protein
MKKIIVVFSALMIISRIVLAGEVTPSTSDMTVSMKGEVVKIFYRTDVARKVKVTIYDAASKAVFSEELKRQSSFVRPYNFENLPFGEYTIVLEDENGKTEETISYTKKRVEVLSSIIERNSKSCMVTLFSKDEANVTVKVLDESKNVLFSESQTVNGQAVKAFNLKKVEGAVRVEVSDSAGLLNSRTIE